MSPQWLHIRKPFLQAVIPCFVLLQLLFLGNMSYLYGTQFQDSSRFHRFNILFVDYDGGVVGQSVLGAYDMLKGNGFPTLVQHPVSKYPTAHDVRQAVCEGHYWGAVYPAPNASSVLATALSDEKAALSYNNSNSMTYIWNGARYPAFSMSAVYANLQTLTQVSRLAYNEINGTAVAKSIDWSNPAIARTLLDPISATEINIRPTNQGARVLYNTVSMVMPIIMQFFFVMGLNGISAGFQLFNKMKPQAVGLLRMTLSVAYTFIGSLCMSGYIWAFREHWHVNGVQFVLTWISIWLYMHVNFAIMETATTFIPMPFMPFFVLTWAILNVASTIAPFELNPGFYRWGYALPSHEVYQVLVQIWSGGCNDQLYRALPILFSWWVVTIAAAILSVHHRCATAVKAAGTGSSESEETPAPASAPDMQHKSVTSPLQDEGKELTLVPSRPEATVSESTELRRLSKPLSQTGSK